MARLRYNGLSNSLGAALTSGGTTITFASKLTYAGGDVPTITGSDYIPLSVLDADGKCAEVVHLTAYTSAATTGTIARGKEDTSGVAHDSGAVVVNGPTALPGTISLVGTSSVGSSELSLSSNRNYCKAVTLAENDVVLGVEVSITGKTSGAVSEMVGLAWENDSGSPGRLLAGVGLVVNTLFINDSTTRWYTLSMPAFRAPADGTYWIGLFSIDATNNIVLNYETTGGSDKYFTASGDWASDGASVTDTTWDYSMRAVVLKA